MKTASVVDDKKPMFLFFSKNIFVIWLIRISHLEIFWDKHLNCEIEFRHCGESNSLRGSHRQVTQTVDPSSKPCCLLPKGRQSQKTEKKGNSPGSTLGGSLPSRLESPRAEFCLTLPASLPFPLPNLPQPFFFLTFQYKEKQSPLSNYLAYQGG